MNLRQRPVLLPGGWPNRDSERESCARALLACGGDFERIYDNPGISLDSYVRHVCRIPFFKLAQEPPIVCVTGKIQSPITLLSFYTQLFELTRQFDRASWVSYLSSPALLDEFLTNGKAWAEVEDMGGGLYCWYTSPIAVLVLSIKSEFSHLKQTLADLEQSPPSGVIALSSQAEVEPTRTRIEAPLPQRKPSSSLSSNTIARLTLETHSLAAKRDSTGRITPAPPNNPRIRRHTG